MNIKTIIVPVLGAALIGGAFAGAGLTAFAASDSTVTSAQQAVHKDLETRGGPGISGTVTAINGGTLTVTGANGAIYTILASGATVEKYANGTSSNVTVANIVVGDTVVVNGQVQTATLTAKDIHVGTFPKPIRPIVVGKVTAVSGNTITLSGKVKSTTTSYTIDASAATISKVTKVTGAKPTLTTIAVSGIVVGDNLVVEGTANGSAIKATKIIDGAAFGGFNGFAHIEKGGKKDN